MVSDGSCVCHRCIVLLLFRGVHGLMATRLYPLLYRGTPLHKASNIYLPVLIPSSIWICLCKSSTFAVTKLACGFVVYDSALRGEIWLF